MDQPLANVWRRIIIGEGKSWVAFSHGTCVIFIELPDNDGPVDIADAALALMREWGPVRVASSAGDFSVITLDDEPGWVVTGHHPDILTYVSPDELAPSPSHLEIGLHGRGKRDADAHDLAIVHVEHAPAPG